MTTKNIMWWLLGVAFATAACAIQYYCNEDERIRNQRRDARLAEMAHDKEQFDKDYADVVDMVYQRDEKIYEHLLNANRKLLSTLESRIKVGEGKTEYRKSLEKEMVSWLKLEIHLCELTKSRMEFERDNSPRKARWIDFKVFASRCDCHN